MAQRQNLDGDADLDPLGARRDRAGDAERRREQRALRIEVELGQPHRIEPPALGRIDLRERLLKGLFLGSAGKGRKLVEHAEFHGGDFLRVFNEWTPRRRITLLHRNYRGDRIPCKRRLSAHRPAAITMFEFTLGAIAVLPLPTKGAWLLTSLCLLVWAVSRSTGLALVSSCSQTPARFLAGIRNTAAPGPAAAPP